MHESCGRSITFTIRMCFHYSYPATPLTIGASLPRKTTSANSDGVLRDAKRPIVPCGFSSLLPPRGHFGQNLVEGFFLIVREHQVDFRRFLLLQFVDLFLQCLDLLAVCRLDRVNLFLLCVG